MMQLQGPPNDQSANPVRQGSGRATPSSSAGADDVDLEARTITGPVGVNDGGQLGPLRHRPLPQAIAVVGMDDISFTLNHKGNIAAFEARFAKELPWI
jgi:3-isopropylmalate dehydratase small subunit